MYMLFARETLNFYSEPCECPTICAEDDMQTCAANFFKNEKSFVTNSHKLKPTLLGIMSLSIYFY